MPENQYEKMQALIIDDFESFRITLNKMLHDFGVGEVHMAANSTEALRQCQSIAYDIILCDQNLGKGKTGQQILEVLRHTSNPNSETLFLLISAEANKSIIMAAYDYEPDAYLTKPITAKALGERLERLFAQRLALAPVYKALKGGDKAAAISLCQAEIANGNRYSGSCQKILGRLLLDTGRYEEAEDLYRQILEMRQLDWAMLGMAQVKKLQDDSLSAQQWLEEIIQFNPLCLKAYDVLSELMAERGDNLARQKILQQAVDLSPLSILRQQALGEVAFKNNDLLSAASAYRRAVKLGENSCHDSLDVHANFARASIQLSKIDKNLAKPILRDALKIVAEIPLRFGKTNKNKMDSYLLESQLFQASGEERKSRESLASAQKIMSTETEPVSLESQIELVNTLRDQGYKGESEKLIAQLMATYAGQEEELQKIDCLLEEPCSVKNKAVVAKINKDGIGFYEAKDYVRAIEAFTSALQNFPQHVGLRLNLVQALLGQASQIADKSSVLTPAQQTLEYIKQIITQSHPQYRRYLQLEELLRSIHAGK